MDHSIILVRKGVVDVAQAKKNQNQLALSELKKKVSRQVEIQVLGLDLVLTPPKLENAVAVRERMMDESEAANKEGGKTGGLFLSMAIHALIACLPDASLSVQDATDLILSTGGEKGELAVKVTRMVGLHQMSDLFSGGPSPF